ncbi:glycosyltransferase [Thermococcus sp. JCM 11816]|uniref:glycosyltransferase n=1 Tax=Thermococcus sp. (strain JCM 11816 / KS-1) TaxID=1295125 RepID=UPI003467E249
MVVVEALALGGTPAIVSRVGGEFPVIVDDKKSGLLARLDERDIAEKILFLLEDEKMRRKMAVTGGRKAIKRFIS